MLEASPAELTLITNPAQQILPRIVEEALEIAVEGVFYAQQIFGPALRRIAAGARGRRRTPTSPRSASRSTSSSRSLQNVVIPPAIALTVVTESPEPAGPSLSFGQLFLPGMLFMSFLFIASGMGGDIWEEQRMGTLRRALTTPQSAHRLLAGKLVAGVVMMAAIGAHRTRGAAPRCSTSRGRACPARSLWCAFAGGALLAL